MWYYKIAHPWREKGTEVPVSPSGAYTNDLTSFHQALLPKGSTTSTIITGYQQKSAFEGHLNFIPSHYT
jgi:hypothetical protein